MPKKVKQNKVEPVMEMSINGIPYFKFKVDLISNDTNLNKFN